MQILVIDDHPLIREGLSSLLRQLDPNVDVVDAISAEQARKALAASDALSLVLLDLSKSTGDPVRGTDQTVLDLARESVVKTAFVDA